MAHLSSQGVSLAPQSSPPQFPQGHAIRCIWKHTPLLLPYTPKSKNCHPIHVPQPQGTLGSRAGRLGCAAHFSGEYQMTIGQKIYQAIEQFAVEPFHYKRFITCLRQALVDQGAALDLAEKMAVIASDSLREHDGNDFHMGMAKVITLNPEFEQTMFQDIEAASAMHKYMSFYLSIAELQPAYAEH